MSREVDPKDGKPKKSEAQRRVEAAEAKLAEQEKEIEALKAAQKKPKPDPETEPETEESDEQEEHALIQQKREQWVEEAKLIAPILVPVVKVPFDAAAEKRGEFWRLGDDEANHIAIAIAVILEKHLPDFLLKWQEEIALGALLGSAFYSRYQLDKQARAKEKVQTSEPSPRNNGHDGNREDSPTKGIANALSK